MPSGSKAAPPSALYEHLALDLFNEARKGRILVTEFVDARTGTQYIADLTYIASNVPSPNREEWLRDLLRSSLIVEVNGRSTKRDELEAISGAVSLDSFERVLGTLFNLAHPATTQHGGLSFRLINIKDGCSPSCHFITSGHVSLDIAMRALMRASKEKLASTVTTHAEN